MLPPRPSWRQSRSCPRKKKTFGEPGLFEYSTLRALTPWQGMMRSNSHPATILASLAMALRNAEIRNRSTRMRGSVRYVRLVLTLTPDEVLVELGVRAELLGEETGLALLGLGVLFVGGQVEDQVCDDEGLCWLVKPGDILLAEAGEVASVDLFGTTESGTFVHTSSNSRYLHRPQTRTCFRHRPCRLGTMRCQGR